MRLMQIEELSEKLGFSVASIKAHLQRRNFDAIPPPIRLGRKRCWVEEAVDAWIDAKIKKSNHEMPTIFKPLYTKHGSVNQNQRRG